jgi:PIN like domain
MKFLLDHNLPPVWAPVLDLLTEKQWGPKHRIFKLSDKFAPNTPDVVWLKELARQGDWSVISKDFFRKGRVERNVFRANDVNVFVLAKSYLGSHDYWRSTAQLILWWPKIIAQAESTRRQAVQVPWNLSSRFTAI